MTFPQSAVSDLLDALRAGDGVDLVRESVRMVLQELIEAEATEAIGAGRYERTPGRVTERNGTRPKTLATPAGEVDLQIPKLREGSFFPSLLERRRRVDQALFAVVMEAYVHGVSTRKVDDLVKALGAGAPGDADAAVVELLRKGITARDILTRKAVLACTEHDVGALQVGGGVAANSRLRAMAQQRCDDAGIQLRVPRPGLCTDNGAMVASLGAQMMLKGRPASDLSLPADSSLPVTDVRTGLPVHVDHDHAH